MTIAAGIGALSALTACSGSNSSPTSPTGPSVSAQVVSVSPAGGATGVNVNASVVVTFSKPMHATAASFVALHRGTVTGPTVAGHYMWSGDSTMMTFSPDSMMAANATYVLHMGGGMFDAAGDTVSLARCAQFGGQTVTAQMMGGGMMGGGEMGAGWQTPGSSNYGMMFSFTTH
ncbi:MAG: Ig-like domain-containing protein [Gemmatimonadota bacterium]|nr:Ig-like domain-containing protein [Gemmatimonadota bacterium]